MFRNINAKQTTFHLFCGFSIYPFRRKGINEREMPETDSAEDASILDRIRRGDKNALVEVYHANYNMVKTYILKNNGALEDAEDLLQDALVVFWQNCHKAEFQLTSKVSTYIMAICKNLWLKQLNKNSRMTGEENISAAQHSILPDHGKAMDMKKLSAALEEIGDTCRNILVMFYFDGYDMDNIAKAMNFANADTAKAKKYQCFKKLEEIIRRRYNISDFLK